MTYKKTFWMNVLFAILWVLGCLLSFATDINYVEHSQTYKILSLLTQLFIFATSIVTAVHLYKSNKSSSTKLAIFSNYSSISLTIGYLIYMLYFRDFSYLLSIDFLILIFVYSLFITPFVINLKALKPSFSLV
jgi:hypothetical protein